MSTRRAGAASPQLARIARLTYTDVKDLDGLAGIDDADLRTLHDQIAEMYFGAGRESFARVAGLSKALPGVVAGKLAQRFLPPHLAAQIAVLLEPAKARELVTKVSLPYLADLSLSLDPTRARPIVQAIPAERIGEVAAELFRRGDYAAVAEFADTVTLDGLRAALSAAGGRDLLEVVPLLVWNDTVEAAIADMPAAQIDAIFAAVVRDELWEEADDFAAHLPPAASKRAADRLADAAPQVLDAWRAAADSRRLGDAAAVLLTTGQQSPA
jgi:hypothetical protein